MQNSLCLTIQKDLKIKKITFYTNANLLDVSQQTKYIKLNHFAFRFTWNTNKTYNKNNIVNLRQKSYLSLIDNNNSKLNDENSWGLICDFYYDNENSILNFGILSK